jgi:hypothetical protein
MSEPKMMIEIDIEQLNWIATAILLRIDEIDTIQPEVQTPQTKRERVVLEEFIEVLHDVEHEYEVAVGFDKVMADVREILKG